MIRCPKLPSPVAYGFFPPAALAAAGTLVVNVAVTDVLEETVIEHVAVPLQPAPLHPVKLKPVLGVAVRVTSEPTANEPKHPFPPGSHAVMLPGVPATVPEPTGPDTMTSKVGGSFQLAGGIRLHAPSCS